MRLLALSAIVLLTQFLSSSATADFVFRREVLAEFDFGLVDGTDLANAVQAEFPTTPTEVFAPFSAQGVLDFRIDDSSTGASTLPFTSITGTLQGVAAPDPFVPFFISPNIQF